MLQGCSSCKPITAMQMDEQKPVSGRMEAKFPNLYAYRKDAPVCYYELTMLIEGMERSEEYWKGLLEKCSDEDEALKYSLLEAKLHRSDLKTRLMKLQQDLFPLPF